MTLLCVDADSLQTAGGKAIVSGELQRGCSRGMSDKILAQVRFPDTHTKIVQLVVAMESRRDSIASVVRWCPPPSDVKGACWVEIPTRLPREYECPLFHKSVMKRGWS